MITNKDALQYFQTISSALHDDIELLNNYLHISEFGYLKMFFNNKKYFYLSSDPKMLEDSVKLVNKCAIFYNENIAGYNDYFALPWPKSPVALWMDIYLKNNYSNGLTIIKRNKDGVDLFWVASVKNDGLTDNFYIKNTNVFITFMQYWLKKNRERFVLDAPEILATFADGIDLSNMDKIELNKKIEKEKIRKLLELMRSGGATLHTSTGNVYITPRELECLSIISKGNTAKEVANLLKISSRTVEGHLNNIRSKVGFLYKSNLIKLYKERIIDLDI